MSPTPSLPSVWEPREGRAGTAGGDGSGGPEARRPAGGRRGGPEGSEGQQRFPSLSPVGRRPPLPSWLREETTSSILSGPRGDLGALPPRPGKPGLGRAARPRGRRPPPAPAPRDGPARRGRGQTPLPASASQDGGGCGRPESGARLSEGLGRPAPGPPLGAAAASRPPRSTGRTEVPGLPCGGWAGPGRASSDRGATSAAGSSFVRRLHLRLGRTSPGGAGSEGPRQEASAEARASPSPSPSPSPWRGRWDCGRCGWV